MTLAEQLKSEIEKAAEVLGVAPSTIGERANQGGRFYARLCAGKRVWPETAEKVRSEIEQMLSSGSVPKVSRLSNGNGNDPASSQGAA